MLLLATQAEPQTRAHRHPNLGRVLQPRHYPRAAATARSGVPWAADNDAFNGWDERAERRFLRMIDQLSGLPGCLFVTCPDVVGEAGLTSMLFEVATNPSGLGCRVRPAADVCSNRRTTTRPSSARATDGRRPRSARRNFGRSRRTRIA
jgi:hypothetical protein